MTTTTTTSTGVRSRTDVPGPGTRGAQRAVRDSNPTGRRPTLRLWAVGAIVGVLAVLVGMQPWAGTDEFVPTAPALADEAAIMRAEKELMNATTASGSESLTPRQEQQYLNERARSRQAGRLIADDAATAQAEKELMLRGTVGSPALESLSPRQEHELLVGW